jgi:hypothetical protein
MQHNAINNNYYNNLTTHCGLNISPQSSYGETLTLIVVVFGDGGLQGNKV